MKRILLLVGCIGLSFSGKAQWKYPATKTVDAADTYFGVTYKDPYRWLENLKEKETEEWFKAQANLTEGALGKIPAREALAQEWLALDKLRAVSYGDIYYENGRYFYKKTLGGENVGKLFYRDGLKGAEKLLFDPATYKTGVVTTIPSFVPSWDGKYVALGFSAGGAEYCEVRVLDVAKGTLLPESYYPSMGVAGWLPDNKRFIYDAGKVSDIKSMEIELNRKARVHRIGTSMASDVEILSNEVNPELGIAPKEMPYANIDESSPNYVQGFVGTVQNEMRLFYAPTAELNKGKVNWKVMCTPADNLVRGILFEGDHVYAVTHDRAPRYRLVRTSVKHPDWSRAEAVIPEAADSIQYIARSKHYLFVVYSDGILTRILKYDFKTGKSSDMKLPGSGTVGISCPNVRSDQCFVTVTSWTVPPTRYDYDAAKESWEKSVFNSDVEYPGFADLVTEEVEVPSHDGKMVPLSIVHKKGIAMDGSNSCILEGYGSYGISYTPGFRLLSSVATRGVVMAWAHPRGGSEKGEAWYKAGYKTTKPNTWKDFIACAEYLVKKGYTSPAKLAGTGTSAGGILITRAVTERPDLFAAAVCNVGCANAMRMEFSPNGPVNVPEFGTVTDEVECKALFEMDGYQHVKKGEKYPALLGVAGWNDPRVAVWEPGKFIAAAQNATASDNPALMLVNYDNGHFTEEKLVTFRNFASQFAFMLWRTGHPDFQPKNN
jgi:prolyl oligopeptidase